MPNMSAKFTNTKPMDMENCILIMETFCRANSRMDAVKGKEGGSSRMEVTMKEISRTMWLMGMGNTSISTDTSLKANGKTTFQTAKVRHNTPTEVDTMVNF